MKIIISLITFFLALKVNAQYPQINFLNLQQDRLLKTYVKDSINTTSYFVLLDMNDCINCNLPFKILINSGKLNPKNSILILKNLSKHKIPAFRNEFDIQDSFIVSTDSFLISTLNSFLPKKQSNAVFSYRYNFMLKSLPLKIAVNNSFKQLEINSLAIKESEKLKKDDFFYNRFSQTTVTNNKLLAVVGPKPRVFAFDSNNIVNHIFEFNDTFLIKTAYPFIIAHCHDSIRKNVYNSIDSIIKFYYVDIKPLGLNLLKLNTVSVYNQDVYISGSISIPITTDFDKLRFEPGLFTFVFNNNLELKFIKEYQLNIDTAAGPVDIYGFMVNHADTLMINVQTFSDKEFNPHFLGKWVNENNYYRYEGLDKRVSLPKNEIIAKYFAEIKQLVFKFTPINDSLIAFNYLPYILNVKNSELIKTFNHSVEGFYIPYNLKLCSKINLGKSTYYIFVENILDMSYVSITDLSFNRIQVCALASSLNRPENFFIMNNNLCMVSVTEEGTIISKVSLDNIIK